MRDSLFEVVDLPLSLMLLFISLTLDCLELVVLLNLVVASGVKLPSAGGHGEGFLLFPVRVSKFNHGVNNDL